MKDFKIDRQTLKTLFIGIALLVMRYLCPTNGIEKWKRKSLKLNCRLKSNLD